MSFSASINPATVADRLLFCQECHRLQEGWTNQLAQWTAFVKQSKHEGKASLDQFRRSRDQFNEAYARVTHCWTLLDLHRKSKACNFSKIRSSPDIHGALQEDVRQKRPAKAVGSTRPSQRRLNELHLLAQEGLPIVFLSRWYIKVGLLHIWTQAGRWYNEGTGCRGRIRSLSMRKLIQLEAML